MRTFEVISYLLRTYIFIAVHHKGVIEKLQLLTWCKYSVFINIYIPNVRYTHASLKGFFTVLPFHRPNQVHIPISIHHDNYRKSMFNLVLLGWTNEKCAKGNAAWMCTPLTRVYIVPRPERKSGEKLGGK